MYCCMYYKIMYPVCDDGHGVKTPKGILLGCGSSRRRDYFMQASLVREASGNGDTLDISIDSARGSTYYYIYNIVDQICQHKTVLVVVLVRATMRVCYDTPEQLGQRSVQIM